MDAAGSADDGDPALEAAAGPGAAGAARPSTPPARRARGTAAGKDTDGLLDLIADTPVVGQFRYRQAWPLELWWLGDGQLRAARQAGRTSPSAWTARYPLADQLALSPLRRYGTRGASRGIGIPLVLPDGAAAATCPACSPRSPTPR